MTLDQIIALAAPGESETLECKTSTGTRREAARTVCAMLNQRGGTEMFGVAPDGNVLGQHVGERTIEEVGAEIRRIEAPAFPRGERVQVEDDRAVVVVSVHQGPTQPYTYRGTAYRRVGNTTVALSTHEYGRMHSDRRWENQPATGWQVEDLDADEIRRTAAEAVRRGSFLQHQRSENRLAERQAEVVALLDRTEDGLARGEIRTRLGSAVSDRQLRRVLEDLRSSGMIVSTGHGRAARWKRQKQD